MKKTIASVLILGSLAHGATIALWNQDDNALPGGGFGFEPGDFPQAADVGTGSLSLTNFDTTTSPSGAYTYIQSFNGTSGGSLSPQGGTGGTGNNGMTIDLGVSTTDFENIIVSWNQRGTGTGFTSRAFSYSTDGVTFIPVGTDTGALGSSFVPETYDLSAITALNDVSSVIFRITLDGASSATGNNRFDDILVSGTAIVPEPSTALLGSFAMLGLLARRRK